jgi:hypothetical protein
MISQHVDENSKLTNENDSLAKALQHSVSEISKLKAKLNVAAAESAAHTKLNEEIERLKDELTLKSTW